MLKFAITIPNFNQSHFLPSALESIKFQTVNNNVAVMDGGSTDNLQAVIKEYSDLITYFRHKPDAGQAAAIKKGKDNISGDIVAWLNADDYYFPDTLDKVSKCFESHPDVDVIYGDAIHVSPDGLFLSYFPAIQEFDAKDLTRTCFICQPACFVRRKAYERVGGVDPSLHYTMDWDLWCRLSKSGAKFYYLHEVLAAVRYYSGTKTLSGDLGRYKEIWRIERKYGHRLFPRSWMGAYLYDLGFSERKSLFDKYAFIILKKLRQIKRINKKARFNQVITNYGFYPFDNRVEKNGRILLPWYDSTIWSALRLKVRPANEHYQVIINGHYCQNIRYENGSLRVQVPRIESPYREILIRHKKLKEWRLLRFNCEFENEE